VQGEVFLWPSIGVGLVALGAVMLRVDPIAPLRRPSEASHEPVG
jgi:hypothetical protein